jgi:hypothetical protein
LQDAPTLFVIQKNITWESNNQIKYLSLHDTGTSDPQSIAKRIDLPKVELAMNKRQGYKNYKKMKNINC